MHNTSITSTFVAAAYMADWNVLVDGVSFAVISGTYRDVIAYVDELQLAGFVGVRFFQIRY